MFSVQPSAGTVGTVPQECKKVTLEYCVWDALETGRELGLHTLKAVCLEDMKPRVEPYVEGLVRQGLVKQVKKQRYQLIGDDK